MHSESKKRPQDPEEREGGAHARPHREPLTRERIIAAALRVMDAEGLEAVTMRRIGRELGVEAMSLYNHVRDKEDILDGVTESAMGEFQIPPSTGTWVDDMKAAAREWRRLLRKHPSVMRLLAERHEPLEGVETYRPMEAALELISQSGSGPRDSAQAFNAFGGYIMGFVMMEQGLMLGQEPANHREVHAELAGRLLDAGLPHLVEALPHFVECPTDEQFEFGLDLLIRGLRSRQAETG